MSRKKTLPVKNVLESKAGARPSSVVTSATFQGPIPPPSILQGYETIIPGAAERILVMAEKQQQHDHSIQKIMIEKHHGDFRRGQYCAAVVVLALIAAGAFIAHLGQPIIGGILCATGLASIVTAFLAKSKRPSAQPQTNTISQRQ